MPCPHMTSDVCGICATARDALAAYGAWLDADGYDNPELDKLRNAMERLSDATGYPIPDNTQE